MWTSHPPLVRVGVAVLCGVLVCGLGWLAVRFAQDEARPGPAPSEPSGREPLRREPARGEPAGSGEPMQEAGPADVPAPSKARRTEPPAVRVLHRWDRRRAAAYAEGDVAALRRLYVDAAAARADVRVLRGYLRRGLAVQGMRMQVLGVEVLGSRPGLLRLRVTDRLVGAVAVGGGSRVELPRDRASTRVLVLRRDDGVWRLASVRPGWVSSRTRP